MHAQGSSAFEPWKQRTPWLQVHVLEDGTVQIYSRNLENTTAKYPDIAARMADALQPGVTSVVLDCEAQAWDAEHKVFLPFQVLTTRKRKDVKAEDVTVQARAYPCLIVELLQRHVGCQCIYSSLCVYRWLLHCARTVVGTIGSRSVGCMQVVLYCFDCLYVNGRTLMREPLFARRAALRDSIIEAEGKIQFAMYKTSRDVDELAAFLDEAVEHCTEGLIVKTLADTYEPSKRSLNWLKLKKDYLDGVGDTFDVAVIGALHGKGKRTGAPAPALHCTCLLINLHAARTRTRKPLCTKMFCLMRCSSRAKCRQVWRTLIAASSTGNKSFYFIATKF